jgi:hypothetical protein
MDWYKIASRTVRRHPVDPRKGSHPGRPHSSYRVHRVEVTHDLPAAHNDPGAPLDTREFRSRGKPITPPPPAPPAPAPKASPAPVHHVPSPAAPKAVSKLRKYAPHIAAGTAGLAAAAGVGYALHKHHQTVKKTREMFEKGKEKKAADDYGPGGKWIHDRAHRIMEDNPETKKEVAYAIATQQAHKVGKSPKGFRTPQGVHDAKQKYDEPKSEYQKTASESEETKQKRMRTNKAKALGGLIGVVPGIGAALGVERLLGKTKAVQSLHPVGQFGTGLALGVAGVAGGATAGSRIGKAISKHRQKKELEKKAMLVGFFDELDKLAGPIGDAMAQQRKMSAEGAKSVMNLVNTGNVGGGDTGAGGTVSSSAPAAAISQPPPPTPAITPPPPPSEVTPAAKATDFPGGGDPTKSAPAAVGGPPIGGPPPATAASNVAASKAGLSQASGAISGGFQPGKARGMSMQEALGDVGGGMP